MNKKILTEKTKELLLEYPAYSEEIQDLYYLALDEIEEGGSESHECQLAYSEMLEIINYTDNTNNSNDNPADDLKKEQETHWKEEELQKEIEKKRNY
jgi:hypothetical protein